MSPNDDPEVREWVDRQAIVDLIHRYSDSVTRGDWDQNEAVWAPDAVWECASPFDLRYVGARSIRQQLSEAMTDLEFLIQMPHAPVVRLLGPEHATATTTVHELTRGVASHTTEQAERGSAVNVEFYGVYFDEAVKIDGAWKFAHRRCQPIYLEPGGLSGTLIAARAALVPNV